MWRRNSTADDANCTGKTGGSPSPVVAASPQDGFVRKANSQPCRPHVAPFVGPEQSEGGSVMGKGSRLGDRPHHGDGTRIIRPRIGARATASPTAETVTYQSGIGWRCCDRDGRATGSPAAPWTYLAACPSAHRQVILGGERRCVGGVLSGRDRM